MNVATAVWLFLLLLLSAVPAALGLPRARRGAKLDALGVCRSS